MLDLALEAVIETVVKTGQWFRRKLRRRRRAARHSRR